jgi:hypothetical protein
MLTIKNNACMLLTFVILSVWCSITYTGTQKIMQNSYFNFGISMLVIGMI